MHAQSAFTHTKGKWSEKQGKKIARYIKLQATDLEGQVMLQNRSRKQKKNLDWEIMDEPGGQVSFWEGEKKKAGRASWGQHYVDLRQLLPKPGEAFRWRLATLSDTLYLTGSQASGLAAQEENALNTLIFPPDDRPAVAIPILKLEEKDAQKLVYAIWENEQLTDYPQVLKISAMLIVLLERQNFW
ncbi:MAG: hypothetical protein AAFP92_14555 [Bacteroidota bacterium]